MAIKPICASCGLELTEFGAILFGPPDNKNLVQKFHICVNCYKKIIADFKPNISFGVK